MLPRGGGGAPSAQQMNVLSLKADEGSLLCEAIHRSGLGRGKRGNGDPRLCAGPKGSHTEKSTLPPRKDRQKGAGVEPSPRAPLSQKRRPERKPEALQVVTHGRGIGVRQA